MESQAKAHLADLDRDMAIDALFRVDNWNPAQLPDELLVKAARLYLETIKEPDGGDPCAALRLVLFDFRGRGEPIAAAPAAPPALSEPTKLR